MGVLARPDFDDAGAALRRPRAPRAVEVAGVGPRLVTRGLVAAMWNIRCMPPTLSEMLGYERCRVMFRYYRRADRLPRAQTRSAGGALGSDRSEPKETGTPDDDTSPWLRIRRTRPTGRTDSIYQSTPNSPGGTNRSLSATSPRGTCVPNVWRCCANATSLGDPVHPGQRALPKEPRGPAGRNQR
jgi:hypothetical protein